MNERDSAFQLLQRVDLENEFAAPVLADQSSFVREVVLGVLRWRLRLDYLVTRLSDRPTGKIDQRVLQILRAAIYELMFMNSPAYAVVNEAVSSAARHASRARGFVNAVLRKAAGEDLQKMLPGDEKERRAVELSHPPWLLDRWGVQFGDERAVSIAAANQQQSRADLLVNTWEISLGEAEAILRGKQIGFRHSELVERVLRLDDSSVSLRKEIEQGLFHPMDEGSALVASLARDKGNRVLDAAAAPGGKSLFLMLAGRRVVSHDISLARLALLREVTQRFGRSSHPMVTGDASHPPFRRRFDVVLLDAPCSGTGTIRKNPEIKWRLDPGCFSRFAAIQRKLLGAALRLSSMECVYSTCSIEPEENDHVVEAVLASNSDFELANLSGRLSPTARKWVSNGVLRLTPESGADGFTAFLLRRSR